MDWNMQADCATSNSLTDLSPSPTQTTSFALRTPPLPAPLRSHANSRPPERVRGLFVYRSSVLTATDPTLVADIDEREVAQSPSVHRASAKAEAVHETFNRKGHGFATPAVSRNRGPRRPPRPTATTSGSRKTAILRHLRASAARCPSRRSRTIRRWTTTLVAFLRYSSRRSAPRTSRRVLYLLADAPVVLPPELDFAAHFSHARSVFEASAGL